MQKLNICLCPPIFGLDKFLDCHDKGSFILEGKFSESNASDFSAIVENRIFPFEASSLNDDDICENRFQQQMHVLFFINMN